MYPIKKIPAAYHLGGGDDWMSRLSILSGVAIVAVLIVGAMLFPSKKKRGK